MQFFCGKRVNVWSCQCLWTMFGRFLLSSLVFIIMVVKNIPSRNQWCWRVTGTCYHTYVCHSYKQKQAYLASFLAGFSCNWFTLNSLTFYVVYVSDCLFPVYTVFISKLFLSLLWHSVVFCASFLHLLCLLNVKQALCWAACNALQVVWIL